MFRAWRTASLAGRGEELAALDRRLGQAAGGWGQFVLVEGEAGIGKTRLMAELAQVAETAGFDVYRGAAEELEIAPFAALAGMLGLREVISTLLSESLSDGLWETGGASGGRYRIVEAITGRVESAASERPVVAIVEDLHWADPATVVALRALMRRIRHLPVAVVGTLRPTPRGPDLSVLIDVVSDEDAAEHLHLGALGEEAVDSLAGELAGAPPGPSLGASLRQAGGNPFFVIEIVDSLIDAGRLEVRDGLAEGSGFELDRGRRLSVLRRVRSLAAPTQEALRAAAVLGPSFTLAELAAVLGSSPVELAGALDEAIAAEVLGDAGGRLAFRHELLREAIRGEIAPPIRAGLHLHTGRVLAELGAPALRVAEHMVLGAARGDRRAVRWLRDAAREVVPADPAGAAGLLAKALELSDNADPTRSAIAADLVTALHWSGRNGEAEALARLELEALRDPRDGWVLRLSLLRALVADGRAAEAIAEVEVLSADFSSPAAAQFQVEAAWARLLVGDVTGAKATALATRDGARDAGLEITACGALVVLGYIALMHADLPGALALLGEAVSRADALGTPESQLNAPHVLYAVALLYADRPTEAKRQLRRSRRLAERVGVSYNLPLYELISAIVGFFAGDWEGAVADAEAGFALAEEIGNRQTAVATWAVMAIRAVHANDLPTAARALGLAGAELAAGRSQFHAHWLGWATAIYEEARGETEAARLILGSVWDTCAALGMTCDQPLLGPDLVRLHLATGHDAEARAVTDAVQTSAARIDSAPARTSALRCRGLIENDPEALNAAVAVARTGSQPLALGAACLDGGAVLGGLGRTSDAVALLEEAVDIFDRLGAVREVARGEAALRALGVRRRRPQGTADGTHGLTRTEAAVVALLVGEGLSNRQIAERLFVSHRTVETHVAHIFAKLGVASRAQLIVWSAREAAKAATPGDPAISEN